MTNFARSRSWLTAGAGAALTLALLAAGCGGSSDGYGSGGSTGTAGHAGGGTNGGGTAGTFGSGTAGTNGGGRAGTNGAGTAGTNDYVALSGIQLTRNSALTSLVAANASGTASAMTRKPAMPVSSRVRRVVLFGAIALVSQA